MLIWQGSCNPKRTQSFTFSVLLN